MASNPHIQVDASVAAQENLMSGDFRWVNDEKRSDFSPLTLEQRAWGLWKGVQRCIDEGIPTVVKVWSSRKRRYYSLGSEMSQLDSQEKCLRALESLRESGCI